MAKLKQITSVVLAVAMSFSLLFSNVWATEITIPDDVDEEVTSEPIENEMPVDETETNEMYIDSIDETSINTEDTIVSGDWKCSSNSDGSISITKYTGTAIEIDIPPTINGCTVTQISYRAFYKCSSIKSVTIPNSVTYVDVDVFRGCSSLANLTISNSVTYIGWNAFYGCGLKSVTIPENVTYIGDNAFGYYDNEGQETQIDGFNINGSIASTAYSYAAKKRFTFNYEQPSDYACERIIERDNDGNESLTDNIKITGYYGEENEIEIPSSVGNYTVTQIDAAAFEGCSDLISVTIPDGLTYIGEDAFRGCSSLANIIIPDSVIYIGYRAFYECSSLKSITIPYNIKYIYGFMFYGCSGLTSVTIPEGVKDIGHSAFYGCSSLTDISLPSSITRVSSDAFNNCSSLTDVYYKGSEIDYKENIHYDFEKSVTLHYYSHEKGTYHSAVTSTCTSTGSVEYWDCTDCNKKLDKNGNVISNATVAALGHSFTNYVSDNNATCVADGTKTAKCDRCEVKNTVAAVGSALGHSFTNYVSDKNATDFADGTKTAKCDRCEVTNTVTDVGSATGNHIWNIRIITKVATCLEQGVWTYVCSSCGARYTEAIPTTGHTWNAGVVTTGATPTSTGVKTYTCTVCGASYTEVTPKIKKTAVKNAVTLSATSFKYNGKKQKPAVTVQINGTTVPKSEYTIKYSKSSSKKVGKYKVTIKAKKKSAWLTGSTTKIYKIVE